MKSVYWLIWSPFLGRELCAVHSLVGIQFELVTATIAPSYVVLTSANRLFQVVCALTINLTLNHRSFVGSSHSLTNTKLLKCSIHSSQFRSFEIIEDDDGIQHLAGSASVLDDPPLPKISPPVCTKVQILLTMHLSVQQQHSLSNFGCYWSQINNSMNLHISNSGYMYPLSQKHMLQSSGPNRSTNTAITNVHMHIKMSVHTYVYLKTMLHTDDVCFNVFSGNVLYVVWCLCVCFHNCICANLSFNVLSRTLAQSEM